MVPSYTQLLPDLSPSLLQSSSLYCTPITYPVNHPPLEKTISCFALRAVSTMFSISDSNIINNNPIGQHLDSFHSLLKSRCEEAGIADDVTGSSRMTRLAETSGQSEFESLRGWRVNWIRCQGAGGRACLGDSICFGCPVVGYPLE
jgi:hypothetical protein